MTTLLSKPQNSLHNNQPNTDMLLPQNVFTHVAENAPIADENDILRLPSKILPLYPVPDTTCMNQSADFDNLWVQTTQNGIRQTWAPGHTMFSRGNIKEKARVLEFAKAAVSQYEDQNHHLPYNGPNLLLSTSMLELAISHFLMQKPDLERCYAGNSTHGVLKDLSKAPK